MLNSPVDCKGLIKHPEIERLAKEKVFEIIRFPAYYTDEMVMNELRKTTNTNILYYLAYMNGIVPIVTIGGFKSFVVDLSKSGERIDRNKRKLPRRSTYSSNDT